MHPNSGVADDILEMHPYDPHRAEKNIEVGDYYFKQQNYRAAESRYKEALLYKPNDAEATYRLGVAQESVGEKEEALESFESYLKILPEGPHAEESKTAIERIKNPEQAKTATKEKKKRKLF
jgi:tetratricopeptide (TPR) repeat protein